MGIDIDQFDVGTGYGIAPNATSVTLQFGTTADKYFPGVFTFTVKMKATGPVPVTLSLFTANLLDESYAKVDWTTSMEINCSRFVVQRSYDGNKFTDVETVAGNGTTNLMHSYSVNDNIYSFTGAVVYYRLKQIDLDGKEIYSNIISLKIKKANQSANISPNPFKNLININFEWNKPEVVLVKIFSVQGKKVFFKKIVANKGKNFLKIDNLSNFPSGNYFLQLVSSSQKIIQKITKY